MEEEHYRLIINFLFKSFKKKKIKSLSEIAEPVKLIKICYELNEKSFVFIKDYIINNLHNDTKRDLNDIIEKLIFDLKTKLYQSNIEEKAKISIDSLILNELESLYKLVHILIVYALMVSHQKNYYHQTVEQGFDRSFRKNIYKIVTYYVSPQENILNLETQKEEKEINEDEENLEEKNLREKLANIPINESLTSSFINVSIMSQSFDNVMEIIEQKLGSFTIQGNNNLNNSLNSSFNFQINSSNDEIIVEKEKDNNIKQLNDDCKKMKKEYELYNQSKDIEIDNLNNRINGLLQKIHVLEKKKVLFKDYNEMKEKANKYDELYEKYEKIKNFSMNKWNLTEPEYIAIIEKKDLDIQKLKDILSTHDSSEIMSNTNISNDNQLKSKNNDCNHK